MLVRIGRCAGTETGKQGIEYIRRHLIYPVRPVHPRRRQTRPAGRDLVLVWVSTGVWGTGAGRERLLVSYRGRFGEPFDTYRGRPGSKLNWINA